MASLRFGTSSAPRFALFGPRSRTLVVVLFLGCAHKSADQPAPSPLDAVQMRACDSCRHNLELCRQQRSSESGAAAACMDEFMTCLSAQQLDSARCQGLN
jgi:hypothetical protein